MKNIEERDLRFDVFKGILIFLVVFGHLIGEFKNDVVIHNIWRIIYLFHMPAFAFISGYFYKDKHNSAKTLLIPLFVFQIIYEFLHFLIYKTFSYYTLQITPYWILWYLFSLFVWKSLYGKLQYIRGLLFFSIIIGLCSGISNEIGYTLSISRTIVFFPYFILGARIKKTEILQTSFSIIKKLMAVSVLIICIFAFIFVFKNIPDKLLNGSYSYSLIELSFKKGVFYRIIVYIISVLIILSFINIMPCGKNCITTFIAKIGHNSMTVYLFHGLFVRIIHVSHVYSFLGNGNNYIFLLIMFLLSGIFCVILSSNWVLVIYKFIISKFEYLLIMRSEKSE